MQKIIATVTNDLSQDQRMHRICTSLARAGYDLTLVGRELPDSLPLPDRPYQQHRILCKHLSGKQFYWEYNQKLTDFLKRAKPAVINSVDLDTLWAGYKAAKTLGAKLVYDAHEYFHETPEVVHRPLIRWIWKQVGAMLIPHTDARYTVGPALAQELSAVYGLPFGVIRNMPYRQHLSEKGPIKEPRILLYQGVLNRGRGIELAIDTLAQLPDWQLWIAGRGDLEEDFRRSSLQSGVDDRVRWLGFVPPEQLPAITEQAHLGLNLLSADSPSYYYSLANKTYDYMQAGLPAIHMDFPEYRRIQQSVGGVLLLEKLSIEKLVALIRQLDEKPNLYRHLHAQCIAAAQHLNWEQEEEKLVEIYKGLMP
ncbi:MAG: glycosyltransferase family 4 protein [Bacteroidota bacterium]